MVCEGIWDPEWMRLRHTAMRLMKRSLPDNYASALIFGMAPTLGSTTNRQLATIASPAQRMWIAGYLDIAVGLLKVEVFLCGGFNRPRLRRRETVLVVLSHWLITVCPINSFIQSVIQSSVHSFIHSFICSFVHSFIHLFIHSCSCSLNEFNQPRRSGDLNTNMTVYWFVVRSIGCWTSTCYLANWYQVHTR